MAMPPRFLYRLYPFAGAPGAWVTQRLPLAGQLVLGLFVASSLFGMDIRQTISYQLAGLMFALMVTAILFGLLWKPKLDVKRVLPNQVTASMPMGYWLEITNLGRYTERDLVVHDRLRQPRISYEEFQTIRTQSRQAANNRFDRAMGFQQWVRLRHLRRGIELEPQSVPAIPPGGTARIKVDAISRRRGWIYFSSIQLLRPDPLGLFRARHTVVAPQALLSLPKRYRAPMINLRSGRRHHKGGLSLAMAVGDAQEFASLRDYRAGDPRKHIHWRSYAKTGNLIVREYQDEYFDRHALVVDTHVATLQSDLFEGVVSVAASIATGERPRDSILDVIFSGQDIIQLSEGRGLGASSLALTYLAEAQPSEDSDLDQLSEMLHFRASQMASVILVIAGWDERRQGLVEELASLDLPSVSIRLSVDIQAPASPLQIGAHQCFVVRTSHIAEDLARVELTS